MSDDEAWIPVPFSNSAGEALELNEAFGEQLTPLTRQQEEEADLEENSQKRFQQIGPGLFLGPFLSLCNVSALRKFSITHALNLSMKRSDVARSLNPPVRVLDVDGLFDGLEADITPFLDRCVRFIREARAEGGSVLVNCQEGRSRSASIVCAYLMAERPGDFSTWEAALAHVKVRRTCVDPNDRFPPQIKLWIAENRPAAPLASAAAAEDGK